MIHPDTEQIFLLSDYFHQLGNALASYIDTNEKDLSDNERNKLFNQQIELLRISGKINMTGVLLVFEDVQETLLELDNITAAVNRAVKKALAVQEAINIATAIISVGTAILSKDLQSIADNTIAAENALKAIKTKT